MKKIVVLSCFLLSTLALISQQSVNVQVVENYEQSNCADQIYCADIQVALNGNDAILLGNSSIRFNYNTEAIQFQGNSEAVSKGSYSSVNFDQNSQCGNLHPYAKHSFDGLIPGDFLISTVLQGSVVDNCEKMLGAEWLSISTVCFDVVDPLASPNITIHGTEGGNPTNLAGTNFNRKSNNPGSNLDNGAFKTLTTNFDNVCKNSETAVEILDAQLSSISIQPVPVSSELTLQLLSNIKEDIQVSIFDLSGKNIATYTERLSDGQNSYQFDVSGLATGAYMLSIEGKDRVLAAKKFIKE